MKSNMLTEDELALLKAIRETCGLSRVAIRRGRAVATAAHAVRQLDTRFVSPCFLDNPVVIFRSPRPSRCRTNAYPIPEF
jgi:hypothetical protein